MVNRLVLEVSLQQKTVDGATKLNWQTLNVSDIPVSDFGEDFPALKDVLPGAGQVGLELGNGKIQVKYDGNIDISQLVKAIANNDTFPIPPLNLNNPKLTYSKEGDETQYSFTSSEGFTIEYGRNNSKDYGTYNFNVNGIPVGKIIDWIGTQFNVSNIGEFIDKDLIVNIEVAQDGQFIYFNGNVDISALVKAVIGNDTLSLPPLNMEDPQFKHFTKGNQTQYSFTSDNIEIEYIRNNQDKTYEFRTKNIPVGDLTKWLNTELGINSIDQFIDGGFNLELTPDNKSINFTGNVNVSELIKAIAKDENLLIPSLNLENPIFTYSKEDGETQYSFRAGELTIGYIKDNKGYKFIVEKIPVDNITDWLNELGLTSIKDFISGDVNIEVTPDKKSISVDGDVDISALVKAIAGNSELLIPSLNLKDPEIAYSTTDGKTQYSFTADNLIVKYIKKDDKTYEFKAEGIPVGKLTQWIEDELNINNIGRFITGNCQCQSGFQ
ncbi:MAG: heavy metal-associated domain-containing protein [Planktothrix sp. GU0601_MAG3]|nr:MAG: heavy metal-associated domain-containing protein [Planktothrix sp. GU0601_MAG3]